MEKKRIFFSIVFITLQQFLEAKYCKVTSSESVSCFNIVTLEDFEAVFEACNSETKELVFDNCNVPLFGCCFEKLTNIERLTIRYSRVNFDFKPVFLIFPNLKILNFPTGVGFTDISKNSFDKLTSLLNLNIEYGRILDISFNAFTNYSVGLSSLITLSFSGNYITGLKEYSFRALNKLENLNLEENDISSISQQAFVGLHALKLLNLRSNYIKDLPFYLFEYTGELQILYLNNNRIEYLHPLMFDGLTKLNALYLQLNKIGLIEPNTFNIFKKGKSLSKLYLFGNNAHLSTRLSENFDALSELIFDGKGLLIKKCVVIDEYYNEPVLALTC